MWGPIAIGAASGIASNEAQKSIDKLVHNSTDNDDMFDHLKNKLASIHNDLSAIAKHYRVLNIPRVDTVVILQPDPAKFQIRTKNYLYNMIFVPNATTAMTANVLGLGTFLFTPAAGWVELDFPDGSELFLTSTTPGTQQNIIFRLSNVPMGANII